MLSTIRAPAVITRTHPVKSVYGCVCPVGQAEALREAEQSVCQRWRAGVGKATGEWKESHGRHMVIEAGLIKRERERERQGKREREKERERDRERVG